MHGLRRTVSVIALTAIDVGGFVLAVVLVPPASGMGWITLWPGPSWWDVLLAGAVIVAVAALKGLYGRRHVRHSANTIVSVWTITFVTILVLMLVIDPTGIGARYVVAWMVGCVFSAAGRYPYDALVALAYGPAGDAPPPSCSAASTRASLPCRPWPCSLRRTV